MEHEYGDGYRDDESEDGSLNQYPNSTDFQGDESGSPEGNDLSVSWIPSYVSLVLSPDSLLSLVLAVVAAVVQSVQRGP